MYGCLYFLQTLILDISYICARLESMLNGGKIMKDLKEEIKFLLVLSEREAIIEKLQEIGRTILQDYELRFYDEHNCVRTVARLIAIELYYINDIVGFVDTTMHSAKKRNPFQTNNYGKEYVHGAGFDICISDQEGVYLSFLVRAVEIRKDDGASYRVYGPINTYDELCEDMSRNKGERLFRSKNTTDSIVMYSPRVRVHDLCEVSSNGENDEKPISCKDIYLRCVIGNIHQTDIKGRSIQMRTKLLENGIEQIAKQNGRKQEDIIEDVYNLCENVFGSLAYTSVKRVLGEDVAKLVKAKYRKA